MGDFYTQGTGIVGKSGGFAGHADCCCTICELDTSAQLDVSFSGITDCVIDDCSIYDCTAFNGNTYRLTWDGSKWLFTGSGFIVFVIPVGAPCASVNFGVEYPLIPSPLTPKNECFRFAGPATPLPQTENNDITICKGSLGFSDCGTGGTGTISVV